MKHEYLVYPGHGVGEVTGTTKTHVHLRILNSGMNIVAMRSAFETLGVRPLMSQDQALTVMRMMLWPEDYRAEVVPVDRDWNRSYRQQMDLLASGDALNVALVYVALTLKDGEHSFGERKLLESARTLLKIELNLVMEVANEHA